MFIYFIHSSNSNRRFFSGFAVYFQWKLFHLMIKRNQFFFYFRFQRNDVESIFFAFCLIWTCKHAHPQTIHFVSSFCHTSKLRTTHTFDKRLSDFCTPASTLMYEVFTAAVYSLAQSISPSLCDYVVYHYFKLWCVALHHVAYFVCTAFGKCNEKHSENGNSSWLSRFCPPIFFRL